MRTPTSFIRVLAKLSFTAVLSVPILAAASGVHPLFNLQSTSQSPFPSDSFTVFDSGQNTNLRVNLPSPQLHHPSL